LIGAGFAKSYLLHLNPNMAYSDMLNTIRPFFYVFYVAGVALLIGFALFIIPLLRKQKA
jgi:hypothetical protein